MKTSVTRKQLLECVRAMQDAESFLDEYIGQLEEKQGQSLNYCEVLWYLKHVHNILADALYE
jgi:hypothetical protein